MNNQDILSTAYHELGHAIACLVYDREFDHVSILPGEGSLGHVKGKGDFALNESDFYCLDEKEKIYLVHRVGVSITIALAGPAAENKFIGSYNPDGAISDMDVVWTYIEHLGLSGKVAETFAHFKEAEADALFTSDQGYPTELWEEIVHLAPTLVERQTMTMDELMYERRRWLEKKRPFDLNNLLIK